MEIILQGTLISAIVMVILVIIDTIMGSAVALYKKEFDWGKFCNFLKHTIAPYVIVWGGLSAIFIGTTYLTQWLGYGIGLSTIIPITGIISIVAAAISAKMIAEIYAKFKKLGIDISDARSKEDS